MQTDTATRPGALPMPQPAAYPPLPRPDNRLGFAEAGIVLIALYALVGIGIGAACGSVLIGMLCGVGVGAFAVGAILLISGSAQAEPRYIWRRDGSRSTVDSSL